MFHSLLAPGSLDGIQNPAGSETIDVTIGASSNGLDLWDYIDRNVTGASGYRVFNVTVASGVRIGSNDIAVPAFTTGSGWPSGSTLTITNNGTITGKGGAGGDYPSGNGGNGGDAMKFTIDATLVNNHIIQGGGGGGGGGTNTADRRIVGGGDGGDLQSGIE
jgi:hypothetical protein